MLTDCCQCWTICDWRIWPKKHEVICKTRDGYAKIGRRALFPYGLEILPTVTSDGKARDKRRIEPSRADDDIHGIYRAVRRFAALFCELHHTFMHYLDIGRKKSLEVLARR